jgi:hypothetical protein
VLYSLLFLLPFTANAETQLCANAYCNPSNWAWYRPAPAGQPYGRNVRLSSEGTWMDRDGGRAWSNQLHGNEKVLSMDNSDERNGELAYQTAFDSFMEGKNTGGNVVEHVKGSRWSTKITTPDGIVLYKDAAQNVAVQGPDGKWHVTNSRGIYASTSLELESRPMATGSMVAKKQSAPKKKIAKLKKIKPAEQVATEEKADGGEKPAKEGEGRKLASVDPAQAAAAGAPEGDQAQLVVPAGDAAAPAKTQAAAPAAADKSPAQADPAASAAASAASAAATAAAMVNEKPTAAPAKTEAAPAKAETAAKADAAPAKAEAAAKAEPAPAKADAAKADLGALEPMAKLLGGAGAAPEAARTPSAVATTAGSAPAAAEKPAAAAAEKTPAPASTPAPAGK